MASPHDRFNKPEDERDVAPLSSGSSSQRNWWLFTIFLCFLLPLLSNIGGEWYHDSQLFSYRQAQCEILSSEIKMRTFSLKSGTSEQWYPLFSVVVYQGDTNIGSARGYTGPQQTYYSDESSAQSQQKQYHVGANYPCWYRYEQGQ